MRDGLLRAVCVIFLGALLPLSVLHIAKGATRNYPMERSVAHPRDIASFDAALAPLLASYAAQAAPFEVFRRRVREVGVKITAAAPGFYALVAPRRAPPQRCFAIAFTSREPAELVVVEALLRELLTRSPRRGLTLLLLIDRSTAPLPHCGFLRDGVSLRVRRRAGPPALVYQPYSRRGVVYDYEYHQVLMETVAHAGFIATPWHLFFREEDRPDAEFLRWWNAHSPVRIAPKNAVFSAAVAAMLPEQGAHVELLARGADCPGIELQLAAPASQPLADLARAALAVFRLAESSDRTLEARHFFFLPANRAFATLRRELMGLGFASALLSLAPELTELYARRRPLSPHKALAPVVPLLASCAAVFVAESPWAAGAAAGLGLAGCRAAWSREQAAWSAFWAKTALAGLVLPVTFYHPLLSVGHLYLTWATALLHRRWGKPASMAALAAALLPLLRWAGAREAWLLVARRDTPLRLFFSFGVLGHAHLAAAFLLS